MNFEDGNIFRSPFALGAAGAVVALKFAPGATWVERATNVLAGSLCAGIGAPVLTDWLRVSSPGAQSFVAFVVGLFGLSLCAAIVQGLKDIKLGDVAASWLRRKE